VLFYIVVHTHIDYRWYSLENNVRLNYIPSGGMQDKEDDV